MFPEFCNGDTWFFQVNFSRIQNIVSSIPLYLINLWNLGQIQYQDESKFLKLEFNSVYIPCHISDKSLPGASFKLTWFIKLRNIDQFCVG